VNYTKYINEAGGLLFTAINHNPAQSATKIGWAFLFRKPEAHQSEKEKRHGKSNEWKSVQG
jgi:hypothetical protein